jgi:hypothetical protein
VAAPSPNTGVLVPEKTVLVFGAVVPRFIQLRQKFGAFRCHGHEYVEGNLEAPNLAPLVEFEPGLNPHSGGGRTRLKVSVIKQPVANVTPKRARSDAAKGHEGRKVRDRLVLVVELSCSCHQHCLQIFSLLLDEPQQAKVLVQPDSEHFAAKPKASPAISASTLIFSLVLYPAAKHFIGASRSLQKDRVVEQI